MLRDPSVRRVALARLISATGAEAAFIVGIWGLAAFEFDATPAQLALLMGVMGLCGLAGSTVAGVLVDRYGPRRVVMVGEALFAPAALALLLPSSVAQLTVAVACASLIGNLVLAAIGSFPPFLETDAARLAKANAAVELASTSAFVSGPAVGALLARALGIDAVFVLDAVTSLVAVAVIAPVATRSMPAHAERQGGFAELREGARFAYGLPALRYLLLLAALIWVSFGAFGALEPLFFREVLRTGPEAIGWVNAIFGAGVAAGTLLIDRFPRAIASVRALTLLTVTSGLGAIAYTSTADVRVVTAAGLVWGVVIGVLFPSLRTLIQLHTPDALLGRTMGAYQAHQNLGELLPLMLVPGLAAVWGVQLVLIGSGVALALACMLLLPLARTLDRQRSIPATSAQGEPVAAH